MGAECINECNYVLKFIAIFTIRYKTIAFCLILTSLIFNRSKSFQQLGMILVSQKNLEPYLHYFQEHTIVILGSLNLGFLVAKVNVWVDQLRGVQAAGVGPTLLHQTH